MSILVNFSCNGLNVDGDIKLNNSPGTSGQVLTSAGAGSIPTWSSSSGGVSLTDDSSTNATYYPTFATNTSGSVSVVDVSSTKLTFNPSTGNLSSTLFTALSDESKKTNVTSIVNALEVISKLKPVNFNWIENNKPSIGVIAQQLEEVLPELVETDVLTGLKSVNYDGLIGILIAAIQELMISKNSEK